MNVKSKTLIFFLLSLILFYFYLLDICLRSLLLYFIEWFHIFYKDNWTFQIFDFFF